MDKISKITGQLANPAAVNTALLHLDRMLGGKDKTIDHILACYRQVPRGRPISIVRFDLASNRADAIHTITGELSGTTYSWDGLSSMVAGNQENTKSPHRGDYGFTPEPEWGGAAYQDILRDLYEAFMNTQMGRETYAEQQRDRIKRAKEEMKAEQRRQTRRVIQLDLLKEALTVFAEAHIIEERSTRNGAPFLVVNMTGSDEYEIHGIAYIFDLDTIAAVREDMDGLSLRIIPSQDPRYPPKVRLAR